MWGALALVGAAVVGARLAEAGAPKTIGTVAFLAGGASRSGDDGKNWVALKQGASIQASDRLKTDASAKLEAKLQDGSMLRLGANSELKLQDVRFDKKKKQVRTKLFVGRLWAKVTSLFGSDANGLAQALRRKVEPLGWEVVIGHPGYDEARSQVPFLAHVTGEMLGHALLVEEVLPRGVIVADPAFGEWRPIPRQANAVQSTLAGEYFCPGRAAIRTSEEGQKAVRAGGHPGLARENRPYD